MLLCVNNKSVETKKNYTILQLCSTMGIEIPRFCYHSKLSIAANCRMCLIQLEGSSKPVASCAVGIFEGIRFYTNSHMVKKARESVLEFLLINHPLDCPICDQGGECDLQDQTMIFGSDRGRFYEKKRAVKDFFSGVFIKTFMTRCIHCTRCVRFNSEIENQHILGTLGRGQNTRINTYIKCSLNSKISGNLADICPVGALTSKNQSFILRPWELTSVYSVDPYDIIQSKIRIDFKGNTIMRVLSGEEVLKKNWISNKTRFMFDGLSYQRIINPHCLNKNFLNSWEKILLASSKKLLQKDLFEEAKRETTANTTKASSFVEAEALVVFKNKKRNFMKNKIYWRVLAFRGKFI